MVIKLQAWEPDTCAAGERPCRILITWETDQAPELREHRIAAVERTCSVHADTVPAAELQWWDGNWKPRQAYIQYQRSWYLWRNREQWIARQALEPEIGPPPPQIANYTTEPATTGSVTPPAQAQRDALTRVHNWNKDHNDRKNLGILIPGQVRAGINTSLITWSYSGSGDARVLTINCGGQLTSQQRNTAQGLADTQFGVGKVIIVA